MHIIVGSEELLVFIADIVAIQKREIDGQSIIYVRGSHVFVVDESQEAIMQKIEEQRQAARAAYTWKH